MDINEMEETVAALYGLNMAQAGALVAHRTMIDALTGAVGLSLPPLLGAVSDNLEKLQAVARDQVEPEGVEAFDSTVAHFQQVLSSFRR
ncbi:hypothetical protein [Massilia cavernae]|uniref:hypothetical protein n=1 Tax=Massilia cavernae TaxID=2320864 RepID=UPI0011C4A78C|nr:hypothetical protein [Massilia cavernae]